jgi:hypothetical protein
METRIIPAAPIVKATKAVAGARRHRLLLGRPNTARGHLYVNAACSYGWPDAGAFLSTDVAPENRDYLESAIIRTQPKTFSRTRSAGTDIFISGLHVVG